ncbi:hypothetical protein HFZ78_13430 [Priestia megaterium]|uniref:Uncharacterized protein n=1 Tax=Priestia megaterium TaxID=1404 RepID=A0A6H1P223_PRIMG|nr:hypothetical protein [Priestia megaterium]QIZ07609.1 hypothetical protein HFZ78_13430 [Priestia megaterium]
MKIDAGIQALIVVGLKAYYRQYRLKPENKAKARQYQDNFFLKVGLEQLNIKGDKLNESN